MFQCEMCKTLHIKEAVVTQTIDLRSPEMIDIEIDFYVSMIVCRHNVKCKNDGAIRLASYFETFEDSPELILDWIDSNWISINEHMCKDSP